MIAKQLIDLSYIDVGKQPLVQGVSGAEERYALDTLNLIMLEKADLGLNFTFLETASDELTTPSYSWRWMRYALAYELVLDPNDQMKIGALRSEALSNLLGYKELIPPPQLTSNTPLGSGNTGFDNYCDFYPETDNEILAEHGAAIAVEAP